MSLATILSSWSEYLSDQEETEYHFYLGDIDYVESTALPTGAMTVQVQFSFDIEWYLVSHGDFL